MDGYDDLSTLFYKAYSNVGVATHEGLIIYMLKN